MRDERMSYFKEKAKAVAVPLLALLLCGVATSPLLDRVWPRVRASQPEFNLLDLEDALGQGVLVGVFGGFRSLIADFVWIAGNADWERSDRAKVETMIKIATTLDPTNSFFWRNGARILAFDIPVWRLREAKLDPDDRTGGEAVAIRNEQAQRAIALLDTVIAREPDNARAIIERAQVYNLVLRDTEKAAADFKLAASKPRAPYFAGRIYSELLLKLKRPREAYDYLRSYYDGLPKNDKFAARDIVYERIREMENDLKIPEAQRYRGPLPEEWAAELRAEGYAEDGTRTPPPETQAPSNAPAPQDAKPSR